MKKIIALGLALALMAGLAACSTTAGGQPQASTALTDEIQPTPQGTVAGAPDIQALLQHVRFLGMYLWQDIASEAEALDKEEWGYKTYLWEQCWLAALQDGLYETDRDDPWYWDILGSAILEPSYAQRVADEVFAFPTDVAAWGTDENGNFASRSGYGMETQAEPLVDSYWYENGTITIDCELSHTNPGDYPIIRGYARYTFNYRPGHTYQPFQLVSIQRLDGEISLAARAEVLAYTIVDCLGPGDLDGRATFTEDEIARFFLHMARYRNDVRHPYTGILSHDENWVYSFSAEGLRRAAFELFGVEGYHFGEAVPVTYNAAQDTYETGMEFGVFSAFACKDLEVRGYTGSSLQAEFTLTDPLWYEGEEGWQAYGRYIITFAIVEEQADFLRFEGIQPA